MKIKSLLIGIFCLIPVSGMAVTVDPPHGGAASGFSCATCHTTHTDLGGIGYDNICLNCHRSGMPKGGNKPFSLADAANPFGTMTGALPSKLYQTSHNWSSPDTSAAAGALPPLTTAMIVNRLGARTDSRLACVRCHNQHDNSNPPFLRMANNSDQLCVDCHRIRNVRSHVAGSHPVSFNYTGAGSKVRTNPAQFYNPPVNANPANPTSDLGKAMGKTSGTLLCSTCHAVHYGDSSSATYDNHSGYYDLKLADGNLLRTDLHGETAEATNICTNCHAGKKAHNSRGQNIQCADCHGAHVAYDKNAVTAGQKIPNVWLVKRYMNVSTLLGSAKVVPVYFQSTTAKNYKDSAGNGVCQSCHEVPVGSGYPPEHSSLSATVCNGCHFHSNSTGSFSTPSASGACNTCHGYPPQANTPGGPRGYAVFNGVPAPFTNESSSAHVTHAGGLAYRRACKECHQGNSHRSGTFQELFIDKTGLVSAFFGAVPAFDGTNPQAPTCSNVYCHSDGAPRNASFVPVLTTKAIPGWANGRGAIVGQPDECRRCHGDASTLTTNSHGKHLTSAIGCAACHSATVTDNKTIKSFILHANGSKNIQFSSFTSAGRAGWSEAAATCATIYCHSSVQGTNGSGAPKDYASPVWGGGSSLCGSCHVDEATDTTGTGSHRLHTNASGVNLDCVKCHLGYTKTAAVAATHVNGFIELGAAGFAYSQGSGSSNPSGNGYGSCSATVCHGSGTVRWGGTLWSTTDQCGKCHSSSAAGAVTAGTSFYNTAFPTKISSNTDVKVGAHTAHITSSENLHPGLACRDCHGDVSLNDATHMNGVSNFNWSVLAKTGNLSPAYNPATGQCSNVYCHGNAMPGGDTSGSNKSPLWNYPAYLPPTLTVAGCRICHGFPPPTSAGHPAVILPAGFPLTAPIGTTCSCHSNINPAGNSYATIFVDKVKHINGTLEAGKCDSCHGYPPASAGFAGTLNNWTGAKAENYLGGGGAHTINSHVSRTARPDDGFAFCITCHSPADHQTSPTVFMPSQNIKVMINQGVRLVPAIQARYSSNRLDGATHQTGTCSNISCHFGATPKWDQNH